VSAPRKNDGEARPGRARRPALTTSLVVYDVNRRRRGGQGGHEARPYDARVLVRIFYQLKLDSSIPLAADCGYVGVDGFVGAGSFGFDSC